jgi:hypothetical protein
MVICEPFRDRMIGLLLNGSEAAPLRIAPTQPDPGKEPLYGSHR